MLNEKACHYITSFFRGSFIPDLCEAKRSVLRNNVGLLLSSISKQCNATSTNCYPKLKPCGHISSILWYLWKRITEWVFLFSWFRTQNFNYFLSRTLLNRIMNESINQYTPGLINGFSNETTCFYHCLIDEFLFTSHFFSPSKMLDSLRKHR